MVTMMIQSQTYSNKNFIYCVPLLLIFNYFPVALLHTARGRAFLRHLELSSFSRFFLSLPLPASLCLSIHLSYEVLVYPLLRKGHREKAIFVPFCHSQWASQNKPRAFPGEDGTKSSHPWDWTVSGWDWAPRCKGITVDQVVGRHQGLCV